MRDRETMKASVRRRYGGPEVLRLEEIPRPEPFDDEVLIRVHAASANLGDWELLHADPLFIAAMAHLMGGTPRHPVPSEGRRRLFEPKHKILGCDLAGTVEAVGKAVTRFQPGDEIFGLCQLGAFAEYVCLRETSALAKKPADLTFEQAAALPQAAFIALQGLRDKGRVEAGQSVLINGAGGGAGTLAVQYAKSLGAHVTAVDNGLKLEMMRSIGADEVVDYTREDYTRSAGRYDLIFDLAAHRPLGETRRVLRDGGVHIVAGGAVGPTLQSALLGPLLSKMRSDKLTFLMAEDRVEDLETAARMATEGTMAPVIARCFPLSETAHALQYMGKGKALGKVIITCSE